MEQNRRTLSRVHHSRVHHFRVHHTAFTSEDGEHKQQHGAGEVLPGNASRAITHERMMKQRELCMVLERLLSLDPRSLFNRHAVCILQRNARCPLCSIFFFPVSWMSVLESFSLSLSRTGDAQDSSTQSGSRLTQRKSERGWLLMQGLISLSSSQYSTQRDTH